MGTRWRLDDHVSFPAMIGSDYCIVVFYNVIFIKRIKDP